MEESTKDFSSDIKKADQMIKYLFAIMNEEEDIDAYYEKSPAEMSDIIKLVDARFPESKYASLDPAFTTFAQVCLNGYATFGIDFIKALLKRTDEVPNICIKGLIDAYNNLLIQNQNLKLELLPEEERIKVMKDLANSEEISDEEFLEKLKNMNVEEN